MLPDFGNDPALAPMTGGPINRRASLFDRALDEEGPFGETRGVVPMAMWRDEDRINIEAELPGVTEHDIDITVQDGMLLIRGERKPEPGRTHLYGGRCFARHERAIALPEAVTTDGVQAELKDGVLSIALPKAPEATPRKIALGSGRGAEARRGTRALAKVATALLTMALVLLAAVGTAS